MELFEIIDSLYDKYVNIWREVCEIESPTAHKPGVDAVGRYYMEKAAELGFETEVFSQPVSGDVVCITMNADVNARPVALSGHMDTVFPVGSFKVSLDDEKIYGPGVCDCKGGTVIALMAMEALKIYGFKKRPVMLLLQSDEENSSRTSGKATINYICEKAKDAVAFLNMEGHQKDYACVWRKGIISYNFEVTGIAAHSSNCARAGANAIVEAAHKIIELEKLKDNDGLTCNCGVISGGTVRNTVAEHCTFSADIRFATREQLEYAREYVKRVAEHTTVDGCSCEAVESSFRLSMERTERNLALLDKMNAIFSRYGLSELPPQGRNGGSDAADVTSYGIPCIDNVGARGGGIHSLGEYAYLDSLKTDTRRIAAVTLEIE